MPKFVTDDPLKKEVTMVKVMQKIKPENRIYKVDLERVRVEKFGDVDEFAKRICDFVCENENPVLINFQEKWFAEGVIPAAIGRCNLSIGYPVDFAKEDIFEAMSEQGLIISAVTGYEGKVAVVDKKGYKEFSPNAIILPK